MSIYLACLHTHVSVGIQHVCATTGLSQTRVSSSMAHACIQRHAPPRLSHNVHIPTHMCSYIHTYRRGLHRFRTCSIAPSFNAYYLHTYIYPAGRLTPFNIYLCIFTLNKPWSGSHLPVRSDTNVARTVYVWTQARTCVDVYQVCATELGGLVRAGRVGEVCRGRGEGRARLRLREGMYVSELLVCTYINIHIE